MSTRIRTWILVAVVVVVASMAVPRRREVSVRPEGAVNPGTAQEVVYLPSNSFVAFRHRPGTLPRLLAQRDDLILDRELMTRDIAIVKVTGGDCDEVINWLVQQEVLHAHRTYHLGSPGHPDSLHVMTSEVIVRFEDGPGFEEVARRVEALGVRPIRRIEWLDGAWVLDLGPTRDGLEVSAELSARQDVLFAHPNWLRFLGMRETVPNDPQFGNQWNLRNVGQGGGVAGADIRATFAWDTSTGANTVIAVIDTGVDSTHVDIVQTAGFDPIAGIVGPGAADDSGTHGTRCAGVAGAKGNNGIFVAGVAPDTTIMPIRLLQGSGFATPTEESAAFVHAADNGADVISCSWGPDGVPFIMPPLVQAAISHATTNGRAGKGCPVFWAAGNANEDVVTDDYVSSPLTIAVGATTNFDVRSGYSDWGLALDLMAPSSGGTRSINTTAPGNSYTSNFGGTSAAAPGAAGVAALMFSVAPQLTWQDIRSILRQTAVQVDAAVATYGLSGHSLTHGHGRIDAEAAVLTALTSLPQPPVLSISTTGVGDVTIASTNMGPLNEWYLLVSLQVNSPVGSGPLFGVGFDGFMSLSMPAGAIPFHSFADVGGGFYWGTVGVPAGLTIQSVLVEIEPGFVLDVSNVVQITF